MPRVLWLEEDPGPLGAPFFVMERVEGRVPPDVMPYTYEGNWLHAASDAEREHLEAATVGLLARLHDQVPVKEAEFLELPATAAAAPSCRCPTRVLRTGWWTGCRVHR